MFAQNIRNSHDALIDAVARLLDRFAKRVVAARKDDGLLPASSAANGHLPLSLADAHGSDELAVDAPRDALDATQIDRAPGNALVLGLTA